MRLDEESEIERARRIVAGADRAKENVEKVRKIIEEFYGLKAEYGTWYEDIEPPAVELKLFSPTGQQVAHFELSWDEDGYVIPDRVSAGKNRISGLDEIKIAVRKLAPKDHRFTYGR